MGNEKMLEGDADVQLVEVAVDDAGPERAQDDGAHLLDHVLHLLPRQQPVPDAPIERGAGVAAYDGEPTAVHHYSLHLLRALEPTNPRQGLDLLQEGVVAGGSHPLDDQAAAVVVGEQLHVPEGPAAQELRRVPRRFLQEAGRGPYGDFQGLELTEELFLGQ